jgi:hypothetical protein
MPVPDHVDLCHEGAAHASMPGSLCSGVTAQRAYRGRARHRPRSWAPAITRPHMPGAGVLAEDSRCSGRVPLVRVRSRKWFRGPDAPGPRQPVPQSVACAAHGSARGASSTGRDTGRRGLPPWGTCPRSTPAAGWRPGERRLSYPRGGKLLSRPQALFAVRCLRFSRPEDPQCWCLERAWRALLWPLGWLLRSEWDIMLTHGMTLLQKGRDVPYDED